MIVASRRGAGISKRGLKGIPSGAQAAENRMGISKRGLKDRHDGHRNVPVLRVNLKKRIERVAETQVARHAGHR